MDLQGFEESDTSLSNETVLVVTGERAGQVVYSYLLRPGERSTRLNQAVQEGDWIIPLRLYESYVACVQVLNVSDGRPGFRVARSPDTCDRWVRVTGDLTGHGGWALFALKLRLQLLLEGLASQSANRRWGDEFALLMERAGLGRPEVHPVMSLRFEVRFPVRYAPDEFLSEKARRLVALSGASLILGKATLVKQIDLPQTVTVCECESLFRQYGVTRGDVVSELHPDSDEHRRVRDWLTTGALAGHDVTSITVRAISCAYCGA